MPAILHHSPENPTREITFDYLEVVSRRKVLLVDDSPLVRAVVSHALGAAGLDVTTLDHPSLLADALTRVTPDVMLVDATYAGVTDDALVELVAPHAKELTVLLFSDRAEDALRALGVRIGAKGIVPKDGAGLAGRLEPYFAG